MDLTSTNFASYLPWVLHEIASSCFVAMDLEMSGIPLSIKQQGHKTLQKHYEENKAAAEKYQILQVGLTICREDKEAGSYLLRPYNIYLNPCLDRNLNVNRDCTLMGWAMDFLAGHRFDVGMLFSNGVRYLSRQEEITTHAVAAQHWAPSPPTDIERKLQDVEDIQFVRAVRVKIDLWLAGGKEARKTPLNIYPPSNSEGKARHGLPTVKTATQKWAVHALVKDEYPSLKSRGMADYILIEQRNGGAMHYNQRMKESNLRIRKHVGFRWIVEALVGGDLSELEQPAFEPLLAAVQDRSITVKALMERLKSRLKENRPILVGHNCFTDMIFFYQCFLGPLPDKVEEFISLIHQTFPIVVDTKYLATQETDAVNPSSSLEELTRTLAKIRTPKIAIESTFSKYWYKRSAHEAGYDSMLTAIAFLKMATHVEGGRLPKGKRGQIEDMSLRLVTALTTPVQDLFPGKVPVPRRGLFQNFFDPEVEGEGPQALRPVVHTSPLALANIGLKEVDEKVQKKLLIPRLGSDFWQNYGNKLRVFAAFERMVDLGPTEEPVDMIKKTEPNGVNGEAKNENKVVKEGVLICLD